MDINLFASVIEDVYSLWKFSSTRMHLWKILNRRKTYWFSRPGIRHSVVYQLYLVIELSDYAAEFPYRLITCISNKHWIILDKQTSSSSVVSGNDGRSLVKSILDAHYSPTEPISRIKDEEVSDLRSQIFF